jgi:hypothetical protein
MAHETSAESGPNHASSAALVGFEVAWEHQPPMRPLVCFLLVAWALGCAHDELPPRAAPSAGSSTLRSSATPDDRIAAAEEAKQAILRELSTADLPAWAGEYKDGDGFTREELYIAPKSGFAYFYDGCICRGALSGDVVVEGEVLRLPAVGDDDSTFGWGLTNTLAPAHVAPVRYLWSPATTITACNDWNRGYVPDLGLAHVGDSREDVNGPLRIPQSFHKYLLSPPIVGRVTHVEAIVVDAYGTPGPSSRIRIDVGNDARALVGMRFVVRVPTASAEYDDQSFIVESAETGKELVLEAEYYGMTPLPRVGAAASTGAF